MPGSLYKGGRIVRLVMDDFMPFSHVEIYPSSNLNLIIGSNGSGKSSIISAICLCLAGKPITTGRNIRLQDFIKHGSDKARLEIELDNPDGRSLIIRRHIYSNGGSKYVMNGHKVTENDVVERIGQFNTQLDNLCQFLPQEKVSEFAKLSPVQLLESVLQAVGDSAMFDQFNNLKVLANESQSLESEIQRTKEYIDIEKKKNEAIQYLAEKYKNVEECNKTKKLLTEKLSLLTYNHIYSKMKYQKNKVGQFKTDVKQYEEKLDPVRNQIEVIENDIRDSNESMRKLKESCRHKKKQIEQMEVEIRSLTTEIYGANVEFKQKVADQEKLKAGIEELERELETYYGEFQSCKQQELTMKAEQQTVEKQIEEVINKILKNEANSDILEKFMKTANLLKQAAESEIQKLSALENRKLEVLKQHDIATHEAVLWLTDNRHIFKKRIYNPMIITLEIPNKDDAIYVENHVKFHDLIAFICEDKDDCMLLLEKLRKQRNLAINTVLAPSKPLSAFKPTISAEELKDKYNFSGYLKDMIKGPEPVISFLCEVYDVHNTPVNKTDKADVEDLISNFRFRQFYVEDFYYSTKRSLYGAKHVSSKCNKLRPPKIFLSFARMNFQLNEVKEKLKLYKSQIQKNDVKKERLRVENQELNKTMDELRIKRKSFVERNASANKIQFLIDQRKAIIAARKNLIVDLSTEKQSLEKYVDSQLKLKFRILEQMLLLLKEIHNSIMECATLQSCVLIFSKKKSIMQEALEDEETALESLQAKYSEAQKNYRMLKEAAVMQLSIASALCNLEITKESINEVLPVLQKRYKEFSDDIKKVESEIFRLDARISCFGESDKAAFDTYQHRNEDILKNEEALECFTSQLETLKQEMKTKKDIWLPHLKELIAKVNNSFSKFFEKIGCAGEICLDTGENEDDFEKYGLSVYVKFQKQASMSQLTYTYHSGGECSVTAIIFILSLQELTEVPFRCVDEINQGMDVAFERKIFDLIATCSANSSQYFLLTPKLLPNLTYPKEIKVHITYTGQGVHDDMDLTVDNIIQRLKIANEEKLSDHD